MLLMLYFSINWEPDADHEQLQEKFEEFPQDVYLLLDGRLQV